MIIGLIHKKRIDQHLFGFKKALIQ